MRTEATPTRVAPAVTPAVGALVVGALLVAVPTGWFLPAALGGALILGVALPLVAGRVGAGPALVGLAAVLCLAPLVLRTVDHIGGGGDPRHETHDGGVIVTRAAAEAIIEGRNPYTVDFSAELPERWQEVMGADGEVVVNPVVDHDPYLPAAALVHVPFVLAGDLLGTGWDPRLLGIALVAATVLVIARRPEPPWARAAAVVAVAGPLTLLFLSWGTNDAQVGCLVVLACLIGARRPGLAGALLAVAVACKFPVLVAVPPLALVLWRTGGRAALRGWWTLPAVLIGTTLPFAMADPGALLDDTVLFNLGLTDVRMPDSGIGLPVLAGHLLPGPLLGLAALLGAVAALVVPLRIVARHTRLEAVAPAAACGLLLLLVPARTFQEAYLTLVLVLAAPAWLLAGGRAGAERVPAPATVEADAVPVPVGGGAGTAGQ